ncbi:MAG: SprB repeat-containing protein, partial [Bacteroidota bacterium]
MFLSTALAAQLDVSVEGEDIGCFGLASGTATATVTNGTAPFTYLWTNGGNTATITNLNAGTYGVTVTDADGLTGSGSITLTEPTRVTATISDPPECDAPFTIAAEPQGGVVPYTYNWSTGADTRGISVPAGDYCVTVVDANLCGYVACTTVEENPPS